jgi:hypothetical protein
MHVRPSHILIAITFLFVFLSVRSIVSAQGATINADPDFDHFYTTGDGNSGVWKPYKISNPGPAIWKAPTEGWPKGPSLWIYGDAIQFDGGVYQVVAVTPGHGYHFEVAWAVVRHGGAAVHDDSQLIRQVGIDPYGGTNPLSPNVQWSGEYTGSGKFAPELAIDQYAQGDHITIYLRAQNRYTDSRNEVFFDHAVLTENGAPPIAVAPPTAVPTVRPTAAPKLAAPTRTRAVVIAPTSTSTPEPTLTATPEPTETREPTPTRTPRATATPDAPAAAPLVSRLTVSLALVACLGAGGGIILLGALIFLFVSRSR